MPAIASDSRGRAELRPHPGAPNVETATVLPRKERPGGRVGDSALYLVTDQATQWEDPANLEPNFPRVRDPPSRSEEVPPPAADGDTTEAEHTPRVPDPPGRTAPPPPSESRYPSAWREVQPLTLQPEQREGQRPPHRRELALVRPSASWEFSVIDQASTQGRLTLVPGPERVPDGALSVSVHEDEASVDELRRRMIDLVAAGVPDASGAADRF